MIVKGVDVQAGDWHGGRQIIRLSRLVYGVHVTFDDGTTGFLGCDEELVIERPLVIEGVASKGGD